MTFLCSHELMGHHFLRFKMASLGYFCFSFFNVSNFYMLLLQGRAIYKKTVWYSSLRMIRSHASMEGTGPSLWYTQRHNLNGKLRTLHSRRILYAPGAIIIHGDFSHGETPTRAKYKLKLFLPVKIRICRCFIANW